MGNRDGVDVFDVSGMDGVRLVAWAADDQGPLWDMNKKYLIPEDTVEKLQELIGDGNATVTVGVEAKTQPQDYCSAGASVFVKLTCDQDEGCLEQTQREAIHLATRFLADGLNRAQDILHQALGLEAPEQIVVKPSSDNAPPRKATKNRVMIGGGKRKSSGGIKNKPNFRR